MCTTSKLIRPCAVALAVSLFVAFGTLVFAEELTKGSGADTVRPSVVAEVEGDISGRTKVQLRGRNISDDWVVLVRRLQREDDALRYVDVHPPKYGGLCQTYVVETGLPGCPDSVLQLAKKLNPRVKDVLALHDKIKVPVLPLHESTWSIVLDTELPQDVVKLRDLEVNWSEQIIERVSHDTQVRLVLRAYDVYLPVSSAEKEKPTELTVKPSFDKGVQGRQIQKRVISDPDSILKKLFSTPALEYYNSCIKPDFRNPAPVPYSLLLGEAEFPQCAANCVGNCPEINLFDTKVYRHPDIKAAIIEGGIDGLARPQGLQTICPPVNFKLDEHHGTMLASIMVSQKANSSAFIGLAPSSRLRAVIEGQLSQRTWAQQLEELAVRTFDTPQVFVFAGQFQYPDNLLEGGALRDEEMRLAHPDVVPVILSNKLIWITAAGQNDETPGHQLTPSRAESPMNLGDQRNVIVVTSCEICTGKAAKLWSNAHYSSAKYGLVNLAAPGGTREEPIPAAADSYQYSHAYGTSQATAFVGGIAAGMLTCFPDKYKADGRFLKTRLQVTADPMPDPLDAARVTGGIVNIKRAFLDPSANWINRGSGFERITDVHWCKDEIQLNDVKSNDEVAKVKVGQIGAITRFFEADQKLQWQIAIADATRASVRWSGPGTWTSDEPLLAGKFGTDPVPREEVVRGQQIFNFLPNARFNNIPVAPCATE